MSTYIQIALLLLQVANSFVTWIRNKQTLDAGEDRAVAKAALIILERTETGKRLMEKIDAMPDRDLDRLIDDLGS